MSHRRFHPAQRHAAGALLLQPRFRLRAPGGAPALRGCGGAEAAWGGTEACCSPEPEHPLAAGRCLLLGLQTSPPAPAVACGPRATSRRSLALRPLPWRSRGCQWLTVPSGDGQGVGWMHPRALSTAEGGQGQGRGGYTGAALPWACSQDPVGRSQPSPPGSSGGAHPGRTARSRQPCHSPGARAALPPRPAAPQPAAQPRAPRRLGLLPSLSGFADRGEEEAVKEICKK